MNEIKASPITRAGFAPFGSLIDTEGADSFLINNGTTERFHALAQAEAVEGEVILSVFRGQPFTPPLTISMMERHPLGSQAFVPLQDHSWIVVVAPDEDGRPGEPQAFLVSGRQGVQYNRNVWHHPLISLEAISDFLIVDRQGEGSNLEEVDYPTPYTLIVDV